MPTTGLATLEHPLPLIGGHDLVEEPLLGARIVQVMVDDLVAQQRARDHAALEARNCLAHRARKALDVGLVRIALEGRPELQLLLDAVQAGSEERPEREIRVRIGTGNARLRAQRLAVPDDTVATGAAVVAPGEGRRR